MMNARMLDGRRSERDEYKEAAGALARRLNALTAENGELRCLASRSREFTGPRPLAQLGPVPGVRRPRNSWLDVCGRVERPSMRTFRYHTEPA
jgi:hypothetical protein